MAHSPIAQVSPPSAAVTRVLVICCARRSNNLRQQIRPSFCGPTDKRHIAAAICDSALQALAAPPAFLQKMRTLLVLSSWVLGCRTQDENETLSAHMHTARAGRKAGSEMHSACLPAGIALQMVSLPCGLSDKKLPGSSHSTQFAHGMRSFQESRTGLHSLEAAPPAQMISALCHIKSAVKQACLSSKEKLKRGDQSRACWQFERRRDELLSHTRQLLARDKISTVSSHYLESHTTGGTHTHASTRMISMSSTSSSSSIKAKVPKLLNEGVVLQPYLQHHSTAETRSSIPPGNGSREGESLITPRTTSNDLQSVPDSVRLHSRRPL